MWLEVITVGPNIIGSTWFGYWVFGFRDAGRGHIGVSLGELGCGGNVKPSGSQYEDLNVAEGQWEERSTAFRDTTEGKREP